MENIFTTNQIQTTIDVIFTEPISLTIDVRKADSLSPLLFNCIKDEMKEVHLQKDNQMCVDDSFRIAGNKDC